MANVQNLKPWQPGRSGNPAGKPKGTRHLSTRIQELMADESFEANILDPKIGIKAYKGMPLDAIIGTAIVKAVNGDEKSREWLAKYGYGNRYSVDIEPSSEAVNAVNTELAESFTEWLKTRTLRDEIT